jgi:hypothetical protein
VGDFTLPPANTLIVGMTGSGKSTFAYRYLLNAPAACRFIFDDLGRAATRLSMTPCYTARDCELALAKQWVIFNPHRMFPGDTKAAFRWFCHWTYQASCRGPGKKFFLVDEVWQWQNNLEMPKELALVVQTGREENLELVCATQLPHKVNASITGQSTELVCFRLNEPLALKCIANLGAESSTVSELPLGSYVAYNRVSPGQVTGKLF